MVEFGIIRVGPISISSPAIEPLQPGACHPEIAVVSPCGWGNLGDAAIVDSVLRALRLHRPSSLVAAFTLNPTDTAQRHGVPAFTVSGFSRPHYAITESRPWAPARAAPVPEGPLDPAHVEQSGVVPAYLGPPPELDPLRRLLQMTPVAREALDVTRMVRSEARHRRLLDEPTRALRLVVVAGGGQLDDFWGGAFGHPYVLWRWAERARAVGARYVVLSVGTGTLRTQVARLFVRRALAAADYRSFRDDASRSLAGCDAIVGRDRTVPDLAYGLPLAAARSRWRPHPGRPLVAISPIAYRDPRVWPTADGAQYRAYIERLGELAARILAGGQDLVLFGTDGPDNRCVEDLHAQTVRRAPELAWRVRCRRLGTHQDLFDMLTEVSAVVASRLHGVLLSHLMGVPVLALSYERKVQTLMTSMGHLRYCLPIDNARVDEAHTLVSELVAGRSSHSEDIVRSIEGFRRAVDWQYDEVFGTSHV